MGRKNRTTTRCINVRRQDKWEGNTVAKEELLQKSDNETTPHNTNRYDQYDEYFSDDDDFLGKLHLQRVTENFYGEYKDILKEAKDQLAIEMYIAGYLRWSGNECKRLQHKFNAYRKEEMLQTISGGGLPRLDFMPSRFGCWCGEEDEDGYDYDYDSEEDTDNEPNETSDSEDEFSLENEEEDCINYPWYAKQLKGIRSWTTTRAEYAQWVELQGDAADQDPYFPSHLDWQEIKKAEKMRELRKRLIEKKRVTENIAVPSQQKKPAPVNAQIKQTKTNELQTTNRFHILNKKKK